MHCPFATASLPTCISLHHLSQSVMPASGLAIFCRTLCLTDFMLSDLALVATHNTISFSARIPLQMITIDLEYLSFWNWDSICLSLKHLWCIYLQVCTYVCTYLSFTQAPNSFHTQVTNRHFQSGVHLIQGKYLKSKESFYHPFTHLFLSTAYRYLTSLKLKQTNLAPAAQPKLLYKLVRRH